MYFLYVGAPIYFLKLFFQGKAELLPAFRFALTPHLYIILYNLISRNRGDVTIRPSASLIFEKSTDFSAFLPPICQIFRKSDRKVIESKVWSALKNFLLLTELTFKRSRDIISLSKSKPFLLCRKKMIDKSLVKLL